jgi:dihydrolipoamide dehydrogenase
MMTSGERFDVIVIGAGTAGLSAAKAAQQTGARVAVIDHGPLGTLCARKGCMPSKILLHSADAMARTGRLPHLGVDLPEPASFNWPVVRARTRELVADFVGHVVRATESSDKFTLIRGAAAFAEDGKLRVDGDVNGGDGRERLLEARSWIIATGSAPTIPPIAGIEKVPYILSDDVFTLDEIPRSVAVLGGGPIGLELGQFLRRAGAEVHLVQRGRTLARLSEGPLLDSLVTALSRELTLHLETTTTAVRQEGAETCVSLRRRDLEKEIRVDRLFVAAGRHPDLEGLRVERVGVRVERGVPVHDEHLRTSNPNIFVAGDAAGAPALLHTASLQGHAAGHNAARPDELQIPPIAPLLTIVFCDPTVATVGLDPEAARRAGYSPCVAFRPWSDQGKARVIDQTEGAAQLVVDAVSKKILGCQIVGPHADLLIHLISYAMHFGATVDDLLAEMIPSLAQRIVRDLEKHECLRGEVAPCDQMQ